MYAWNSFYFVCARVHIAKRVPKLQNQGRDFLVAKSADLSFRVLTQGVCPVVFNIVELF